MVEKPPRQLRSSRAVSLGPLRARTRFALAMVCGLSVASLVVFSTSGCVTYFPVNEYNLARVAVDSARDADAARFAPGMWYKAEEAYQKGQRLYKERRYSSAKEVFIEARNNAERAENAARLTRFQSGDPVP